MNKTTEKRIATWINKMANGAMSRAAWRYKEKYNIKTITEAKAKMPDEITFYPFYNEVENLTVYTNGYLVIQIKGKIEGINYYQGKELKSFDYSKQCKMFSNLEDKNRVDLDLPDKRALKEYIKRTKKTYKEKNLYNHLGRVLYNFGKGRKYPIVNAEYLLAMLECVDQNHAVGALYNNICGMMATEDNDVFFILMSLTKSSYDDREKTNIEMEN